LPNIVNIIYDLCNIQKISYKSRVGFIDDCKNRKKVVIFMR